MANRLANETSPYLLQHKDNPVDWYPWGPEALERARTEDKPILLSVGYSACHWCHVMEHESFASAETAALMNSHFVNIKVDREERPDVDSIYMQAVQQMTGHGGWPMTVFLTPTGAPFYGGTYFPPEPRHGLPSFQQLLEAVHMAYTQRREDVESSAASLREALVKGMAVNPEPATVDEAILQRAFHGIGSRFDHRLGGFGEAPKFPQPMVLDFLLRYWHRTGSEDALGMVEKTLEMMARGGIYDHLGGGFHRYSVDARWLVPHFEKMLYDNALLAQIYIRAFQVSRRTDFRAVAEEILDYVIREMRDASGAFYSSQDADSEGEEGRFYVWSAAEIDELLGSGDGPLFRQFFGVTDGGNWEGGNILHVGTPAEVFAAEAGLNLEALEELLSRGRRKLYQVRGSRISPGRDEKALTSWNAMMLHAFAEAGRVFDDTRYTTVAVDNAEFILRELRKEGALLRSWRAGEAKIPAFLEDHALLAGALLELYAADFDPRWVRESKAIADTMIDQFWSMEEEIFYDTPHDGQELIVRPREIYDNATPSGTSAAVHALGRLARYTGEPGYERIASRVLRGMSDIASRVPQGFGHLLGALASHLAPPTEVAIIGEPDSPGTRALLAVLRGRYLPDTVLAAKPPGADEAIEETIPLLAHRAQVGGLSTAFVCRHFSCRLPVTSAVDLERELNEVLLSNSL